MTKNFKNILNNLERFEELSANRLKLDNLASLKTKLDEVNIQKEKEKSGTTGMSLTGLTKTRGPKKRAQANIIRNLKLKIDKNHKKNELEAQKRHTRKTLQNFLGDSTSSRPVKVN